jgi:hypothetical protein
VGDGSVFEESLEDLLKLGLNRTSGRLSLPADKAGAVVVEYGKKGPAHRRGNLAVRRGWSKPRNCLSYLTKAALSGYNFCHLHPRYFPLPLARDL